MEDIKNAKDNLAGKIKEGTGEILKDDRLEFKGKMQTIKSEIGSRMEDVKEEVAAKANDFIDHVKRSKKDNNQIR